MQQSLAFDTCVQVFNTNRRRGSNRGNRGSIMVGRGSFMSRGVHLVIRGLVAVDFHLVA